MKKTISIILILALAGAALAACADHDVNSGAKTENAAKSDTVIGAEITTDEQTTESGAATDTSDSADKLATAATETDSDSAAQSIVGSWIDKKNNWVYARMIFTENGQMINEDGFFGTYTAAGDLVTVTLGEGTNSYKTEFSLDGDALYYEGEDGERTFVKRDGGDGIVGTWTNDAANEDPSKGLKSEYHFYEDGSCDYVIATVSEYIDLGSGELEVTTSETIRIKYAIEDGDMSLYAEDGTLLAMLTKES